MITSQLLAFVAILVSCVLKVSSLDTFIAAVYEHAVILPNAAVIPVSHEEALALMSQNLDLLETAITSAAKQVPSLNCARFHVEEEWGQGHCQVQLYFWMIYVSGKPTTFALQSESSLLLRVITARILLCFPE